MHSASRVALIAALYLCPLVARADAPVDRPVAKTFTLEKGITVRINSIQTAQRADGTPLSAKFLNGVNSQDMAKGYVVVEMTLQDSLGASAENENLPNFTFGLEFSDGSQMDEAGPDELWAQRFCLSRLQAHVAALDILGHDIVHTVETHLGKSSTAHGFLPLDRDRGTGKITGS